ncbi:TetR/AcrR family transcriptional regulator [Mycolicibacterium sp. HK-90]|uniref:TetR/AcrR family transcriptional regulator n=1 Tax=Mycolicibacterium sp. HK-90 TaxID=3056937 RepID=UPI002658361A|nr:TetR/AcrR family transcriptional regulator [Mycolicibacterium sp. HK-90]WKG04300.1 TetR/AcrR family transcriptional regulator [Mycolicibacterium sp. HK-90]
MSTASTESVWLRPVKKSRNQSLDRDQIIAAAVALMDSDGLAGLSMRKLATNLGTAPMTLYTYVATKDDVLEYALDGVFAEVAVNRATDWRDALKALSHGMFEAFLRHPWAPTLMGRKPPIGPAATDHFSSVLDVLSGAGFRGDALASAVSAVYYYVLGAATAEAAWLQAGQPFADLTAVEVADLESLHGRDAGPAVQFFAARAGDCRQRFDGGLAVILENLRP